MSRRTVHYIKCDECEKEVLIHEQGGLVASGVTVHWSSPFGWRRNDDKDFCGLDCEIASLQRQKKRRDCLHPKWVRPPLTPGALVYSECSDCGKKIAPGDFGSLLEGQRHQKEGD